MITRVHLVRWKCHRDTELSFRPGANALLGPMGSGKSSVIEGVAFALFGTLPALRSHKVHADELIMARPVRCNDAAVEVSFTLEGAEHTVTRKLERGEGTTIAELRREGKLVIDGPSKVTSFVEEALGMDLDLFLNAVYAAQNGLDEFLTLPKGRRVERLDELLGIHRLEAARKLLSSVVTRVAERLEDRRSQARDLERALAGVDLERLAREAAELASAVEALEGRERALAEREASSRAELARLDGLAKRHDGLTLECERLEGREHGLAEQERRLAEEAGAEGSLSAEALERSRAGSSDAVERLGRERERLASLGRDRAREEGEVKGLRRRRDELARQVAAGPGRPLAELERGDAEAEEALSAGRARREGLRAELAGLAKEREALARERGGVGARAKRAEDVRRELDTTGVDADAGAVEARLAEAREEAERLGEQVGELGANVKSLAQSVSELEAAGAACPVCDSPLDPRRREALAAEKREKAARLRSNEQKLRRRLEERRAEAGRLAQALERVRALRRELESLGDPAKEVAALAERQWAVERKEGGLASELERLGPELRAQEARARGARAALEGGREQERAREEHARVERELAAGEARLARLAEEEDGARRAFSEEALAEARARLARIGAAFKRASAAAELAQVRGRRERALAERGALGYSAEAHARAREEVGGLRAEREGLGRELAAQRGLLKEKRERHEQACASQRLLDEARTRASRLESGHEDLVRIRSALLDTQSNVRRSIVEEINGVLSEMWATLYPYGDLTGLRLAIAEGGREQGDYALEAHDSSGRWVSVDGTASGGERSVACLALRVAFSRVLAPGLSWLVFDEPTHNLDRRAVEELAATLRERLPGIFEQVIVITHEELMENAITGACYRVTRDKDEDLPTRIEEV